MQERLAKTGAQHLSFLAAWYFLADSVTEWKPRLINKKQPAHSWSPHEKKQLVDWKTGGNKDANHCRTWGLSNQRRIITHSPPLLTLMRLAKETVALTCHILMKHICGCKSRTTWHPAKAQKTKPRRKLWSPDLQREFSKRLQDKPYLLANLVVWALPEPRMLLQREQIWEPHLWPGLEWATLRARRPDYILHESTTLH